MAALIAAVGQATSVASAAEADEKSGPTTLVKGSLIPPAGKSFDCSATTAQVRSSFGLKLTVPTTDGAGGACDFEVEVHAARGAALTSCAGTVKLDAAQAFNFERGSFSANAEHFGGFKTDVAKLGLADPGSTLTAEIHVTAEP